MKKIIFVLASAAMLTGCFEQRDLYNATGTVLHVDSSWHISLNESEMRDATVLLYRDGKMIREYHSRPNGVTIPVTNGKYEMLLFNGVMESEEVTNLDHVYFRGTESMQTFEAYVAEGSPSGRLGRADGEYIAHNGMPVFAFASDEISVESESIYHIRYDNGKEIAFPDEERMEVNTEYTPRAASYRFKVRMNNIVNPRSAHVAAGALSGFAGSAILVTPHGKPKAGFTVTHHINLATPSGGGRVRTERNDEGENVEIGTIESPVFTSFGPQLTENINGTKAAGQYLFSPKIILKDGTEYTLGTPIDVTPQVRAIAERIHSHHSGDGDIDHEENLFIIDIDDDIQLPVIDPDKIVDVIPWTDDEIIMVWI